MLEVRDLKTTAGSFDLQGITLEAPAGSYGVLLGPPGSGKSVLVETICGLRQATAGQIWIGGVDVTSRKPRERRIGYVPQDYVLFPTKRVVDNISFGLRSRGISRDQARQESHWVVDLLQIGHLLDRWPATLSGGEQQRVALARALAIKPDLLLLDEPVSALDEGLRERVCRDLRGFQRQLGITTIHISHNQEEALAVSDWAAIMNHGALVQVGPMADLLRHPKTEEIGRFLRAENIFEGTAVRTKGGCQLQFLSHSIDISQEREGPVSFMIRPERVEVLHPHEGGPNALSAKLVDSADRGIYQRLEFDIGAPVIVFVAPHHPAATFPTEVTYPVVFSPNAVHVFE